MLPSCGLFFCLSSYFSLCVCPSPFYSSFKDFQRHKMIFPTSSWLWPNCLQHQEKKAQRKRTERSVEQLNRLFLYLLGSIWNLLCLPSASLCHPCRQMLRATVFNDKSSGRLLEFKQGLKTYRFSSNPSSFLVWATAISAEHYWGSIPQCSKQTCPCGLRQDLQWSNLARKRVCYKTIMRHSRILCILCNAKGGPLFFPLLFYGIP